MRIDTRRALGRILALVTKELLAVLRDPRSRMVLIGPPIIQLLLQSFAVTLDVSNVDLAVLDRDGGRWSSELVQRVAASPRFRSVFAVAGEDALARAINLRDASVALSIPADFSRNVEAGRRAPVQLLLDGRRSNSAQIVAGYLERIVAGLGHDLLARAPSGGAAAPPTVAATADAVVVRHWFNPNLDYIWFTVPSLIAVISLLIGLVVTALSVARERELGTFDQLMVSPLRTHEILLGKMLPPMLIGLVHVTMYVLVTVFVFGVPLRGSPVLLYAHLGVYVVAIVGVGLFLSSLASTQQQAILGAFLFGSPAILLSGFATPIENMPAWLQPLTAADPLRYALVVVRGVFLKDLPALEVARQTWPLLLIATVTLTSAAWLFRRRLE
jgi:ABC-2 type transport system permease protein